ncbi:MAG: DUF3810 domain-containing protein [Chitinophagaceae bacterium]
MICSAAFVKVFAFFPHAVELYYSNGVYPYIGQTQRMLLGWIPFSIGDVLYSIFFIYCLRKGYLLLRAVLKKQATRTMFLHAGKRVLFACLLIYTLFNLLWGLNYNRLPMAQQMDLGLERYSTLNLTNLLQVLAARLNNLDSASRSFRAPLTKKRLLFNETINTYSVAARQYPALRYKTPSVKPSIFSYAGNYLGFTGYYNPFSGEAQSNTLVPAFIQPFTTCHEIGHQLGYAKENEANFAGFLAARSSSNPAFRYSLYFDMYSYASRELYRRDSTRAKEQHKLLNLQVKKDYETIRNFYLKYENPLEPVIHKLYGQFLRANQQPQGIRSYNEVVAMLLAFYKKYGEI